MNVKEKFDKIVHYIEMNIYEDDLIISEQCSKELFVNFRDLNAAFTFISGMSLNTYIKERKLMSSYLYLISEKKPNIDKAIDISGMSNRQSFGKKFKQVFGITPKNATELRDKTKYKNSLSWDLLIGKESNINEEYTEISTREKYDIPMGTEISKEDYEWLVRLEDLRSYYNFDENEMDAVRILLNCDDIGIDNAFMYINQMLIDSIDYNIDLKSLAINMVQQVEKNKIRPCNYSLELIYKKYILPLIDYYTDEEDWFEEFYEYPEINDEDDRTSFVPEDAYYFDEYDENNHPNWDEYDFETDMYLDDTKDFM